MSETAEKAIKVLEVLSSYDAPVRLVDLSRQMQMNKSTTYRLLEKLRQLGYVRQDEPNGRYMLTVRMWEIGVRAFRRFDLRAWARPHLEDIHRATNETAVLAILDGREVVIIDKIDSAQAIQPFSPLGSRTPLHCSSLGKALIAADPQTLLATLSDPLQSFTPRTAPSVARLAAEIETARAEGVAVAVDEFREGVSGVAAPIAGMERTPFGVLGVTLPTARATPDRLPGIKTAVRTAAAALSTALGRGAG
ncbi:MAG: IclR family transcriptional regulator [Methylobacteriaceae bacterium]|nr:IclR family transcriptional regulator [Methylobacteriaceae bacterium]